MTECVSLLARLVAHSTVNPGGDEPGLARLLGEELAARSAETVEVVEVPRDGETGAYVWATYGQPTTIINVHLDTVPVTTGWTRPPLEMTHEADTLYGLGTADTKGAIASVLSAIDRVRPANLGVLFSGDEERGTTCIDHFLASDRAAGIERAIVCEPTRRKAGACHRGIRAYRLSVGGDGGHSSRADELAKPLVTMAQLAIELDALGESYLESGPDDMRGLCLNIGRLGGGVAFNVIPESAELIFSVRPPPGFDAPRFAAELGTCLRRVSDEVKLECLMEREPFACRDAEWFRDVLGDFPAEFVKLDFWTEASMLAGAGIDAVVIGPGDISVAHGPDERVTVGDLEWAEAMFASVFEKLG